MTAGRAAITGPPAPAARVARDPYEALAELAEAELSAIDDGDIDAVLAIQACRETLIAALPDVPPASARPALERAAATQRLAVARLAAQRAEVGAELEQLGRGRRAAQTYAAAAPPRHGLDLPA